MRDCWVARVVPESAGVDHLEFAKLIEPGGGAIPLLGRVACGDVGIILCSVVILTARPF